MPQYRSMNSSRETGRLTSSFNNTNIKNSRGVSPISWSSDNHLLLANFFGFHSRDHLFVKLHLLGIEHKKLVFKYKGRNFRLTDVHGHVVEKILT
ncbi:MAG TPA: hypothetical protein DDW68_06095 [Verrucomicrobiales bacterium]|nr:hypothetical protein [Verrucomicrobiales bacterium]